MIAIGVTGSIGMGKSTVSGWLREMGIAVHDSDAAVHGLLGPGGGAVGAVGALFPASLQKNSEGAMFIDRKILGQQVFGDADLKKKLEDILHPLVRAESDAFLARQRASAAAFAVLDIPLLFETGGEKRVDVTLCVTAPADVQRARVLARPGMTEEKFQRVLAGQMPDAEKRRRADIVIDTARPPEETKRQLQTILHDLKKKEKVKRHDPRNHP
jgi:dephospho-CoA kinase